MKKVLLSTSLLLLCGTIFSGAANTANYEVMPRTPRMVKNAQKDDNTLIIYNCADYIDEELIIAFEEEYDCNVEYYTYDTNETMYNQFTLQPEGTYDLICASEYMLQRMIREGLVEPLNIKEECPVYDQYASNEVRSKLKNMSADTDGDGKKDTSLDNYIAGYMWGTLGIIYDPYCSDTIREDVKSWDIFWDSKYEDLISIKNSMRDTFVVGLMHAYKGSEISGLEVVLTPAREAYLAALELATTEEQKELARKEYNDIIQGIFDLVITEKDHLPILEMVKKELIALKDNIFGFEVDSGKNDIITGKIKMNLAWSGDAVYSIGEGEKVGKTLEYFVPEDGANVWYDGWTLPKGSNRELACAFIDYISSPENAAQNMEYIGYTSFVSCDDVFDMISDWYGLSQYNESTVYHGPYYDPEENIHYEGSYVLYEGKYYNCLLTSEQYDQGDIIEIDGIDPTDETVWIEVNVDELELGNPIDLGFLFKDNMSEGRDTIIYPFAECENQLLTQYPTQNTIAGCAIMNDFEDANADVVIMWGQLRAYTNMVPYYVFLITVVSVAIIWFVYSTIKKNKSTRNKRRLANLK